MKFAVHVMPPPPKQRPPGSTPAPFSSTPPTMSPAYPRTPLKTLAVPIDPDATFAALWAETEKRFRRAFDQDKMAGMYFSYLMDAEGGHILTSDIVGSMYREDAPAPERQLYMYLDDIDRESTIPVGSELRPHGFQKRRWADMTEAEQATVKRRRAEEQRYGAPVDELDPDTPILSREAGNEGAVAQGNAVQSPREGTVRMDAQGFKIPARPNKSIRRDAPPLSQQSPIVLVNSSQPEQDTSKEPPAPKSADRSSSGETPPSAQRPVPTQPVEDELVALPETPPTNAFHVMGKRKSASKSGGKGWSAEEDDVILEGHKKGWTSIKIVSKLPGTHRSDSAVRNRSRLLLLRQTQAEKGSRSKTVRQEGQMLAFSSSPPVASGSTAPRSSPCETASHVKSPRPTACVQLTQPPPSAPKSFLESSPAELVEKPVHAQTATPPTSNASETSGGKLRAPAAGPTNASRLRKARTRGKPPVLRAPPREVQVNPAKTAADRMPEEIAGAEDHPHEAEDVLDSSREAMLFSNTPDLSVAPDVVESQQNVNNTADDQVDTSAKDDISTAPAVSDSNVPAQPAPEITLPQRKKDSMHNGRTDKQRWQEALELAKGDKTKARHIFIVNLNKEDMLDAVIADDQAEIARLKAQRRRRERELAMSKGLPTPKRRVPTSFSSKSSSRPDLQDADEEVVREDDWTTDEDEARQKAANEEREEEMSDGGLIYSDDDDDLLDAEATLAGPRIVELEDSPPAVAAVQTANNDGNVSALSAAPFIKYNEFQQSSLPAAAPTETSSSRGGKKRRQRRRRSSRMRDSATLECPKNVREATSVSNVTSGTTALPVLLKAEAVTGDSKKRHPNQHDAVSSDVLPAQVLATTTPPIASARLSPLQDQKVVPASVPAAQKAIKARKPDRVVSGPSQPISPRIEPITPAKSTSQRKDATLSSKPSQAGKKKLVSTPKKKLTRDEAVAAHLAECKRKEALYLNNDDDSDDSSASSSS